MPRKIKIPERFTIISLLFVLTFMSFLASSCLAAQLRYSNQPDLQIPFALEKEDLDTFLKLDEEAMKILVQEGRVILLEPGTKYTLIESGFLSLTSKVMITSGLLKGQKGYVPSSTRDVVSELTGRELQEIDNKAEENQGQEGNVSKEWPSVKKYLDQINPITIGFGEKLKDSLHEFNLASKKSFLIPKGDIKRIETIDLRTKKIIKQYKEQLGSLSVPEICKEVHSLHGKKFDIVENLWRATIEGNEEQVRISRNQLSQNAYEINKQLEQILKYFENYINEINNLKYKVVEREDDSFPLMKRIFYKITVSLKTTDEEIKKISTQILEKELNLDSNLNALWIFIYFEGLDTSFNAYASSIWGPPGGWGDFENKSDRTKYKWEFKILYPLLRESILKAQGDPYKTGLTLEIRKKICYELDLSWIKANAESHAKYPNTLTPDANFEECLEARRYGRKLEEDYKKEILKKYNITEETLRNIKIECGEACWPLPKFEEEYKKFFKY